MRNLEKQPPKVALWLWLSVLCVLIVTVDAALITYEDRRQKDTAKILTNGEAILLASFVRETLATQNYELNEYLLNEWGSTHADVIHIRLTSQNGNILAEYRQEEVARLPFLVERDIKYGYNQLAKLTLVKDLSSLGINLKSYALGVVGASLLVVLILALLFLLAMNRREHELLSRFALVDGLTDIANRRCFDEALRREWGRAQRSRNPFSLILVDIDFFKAYNDNLGHLQGDACLRRVAQALANVAKRSSDLVARYGGEEFCAILPDTDEAGAVLVANAMHKAIQALALPHPNSSIASVVSVSLGVATWNTTTTIPADDLLRRADQALFSAKKRGRNQVCNGQACGE